MAEYQQVGHHTHRHRRRRKHRSLKRRIMVTSAVILFLAAWSLFILWYQGSLARKGDPVKKFDSVSPMFSKEKQ